MTTIIISLLSSVLAPVIYGCFILKQIGSSEKSNEKLMALLLEERNMMNARLGQILIEHQQHRDRDRKAPKVNCDPAVL